MFTFALLTRRGIRIVRRLQRRATTRNQHRTIASPAQRATSELLTKYNSTAALVRTQHLDAHQAQKLSLMLNRREIQPGNIVLPDPPKNGTPLPPGYHLVYFTPASLENGLGADGSDRTFNPPGGFTRRMWAGGSLEWKAGNPLRVGDHVEEKTRLVAATPKKSRSGHEMIIVEVEKEFSNANGLALRDRRSWVFQPKDTQSLGTKATPGGTTAAMVTIAGKSVVRDATSAEGDVQRRHLTWSSAALFCFSALTYNAHMIHYSDPWCREMEGFPGLVVHGPLNLINMLDLWRDEHAGDGHLPLSIEYRALAPLYAGTPYVVETSKRIELEDQCKKCEISVTSGNESIHMRGVVRSK